MRNSILSIILGASMLGSPTANAMTFPDNLAFYVSIGGVVVSSLLKHVSKRISPRAEFDIIWDTTCVLCSVTAVITDRMFTKEQLDAGLQEIKASLPAILNAGKSNCLKELAECKDKEEQCKHAVTPINVSHQIIALNEGRARTAEILLENAALKIDTHTSSVPGLTNYDAITKILTDLATEFLGIYPGFTNKKRRFYAIPDFVPDSTGALYWYNETVISTTAASLGFKERLKKESLIKLQKFLDTFAQAGKEGAAKALYMHHFFETLGLNIPMSESLAKFEASFRNSDL